jgi:hypothetical protein
MIETPYRTVTKPAIIAGVYTLSIFEMGRFSDFTRFGNPLAFGIWLLVIRGERVPALVAPPPPRASLVNLCLPCKTAPKLLACQRLPDFPFTSCVCDSAFTRFCAPENTELTLPRRLFETLPFRQFSAIGWRPTVMRKIVVFGTLLACVAWTALAQSGKEKPETLLRWHFAGTKQVAKVKDLQTFREVIGLPETEALREAAAKHLATRAAARFTKAADTNANAEIIRLIQPLLPDLWREESSFR